MPRPGRNEAEERREARQQRASHGTFRPPSRRARLSSRASRDARREVLGLGEIFIEIVQLPRVLVRVPRPGANFAIVAGSSFHGMRSRRAQAIQPSLYIARLPRISKYCCVCRSCRIGVVEGVGEARAVDRHLRDAVDLLGRREPVTSRIVGTTSMTWVNWRAAALSLMRAGQETTIGLRVPPRWEATCLPHWNGVLPAQAQAQAKCGCMHRTAPGVHPAVGVDQLELLLGGRAGLR